MSIEPLGAALLALARNAIEQRFGGKSRAFEPAPSLRARAPHSLRLRKTGSCEVVLAASKRTVL